MRNSLALTLVALLLALGGVFYLLFSGPAPAVAVDPTAPERSDSSAPARASETVTAPAADAAPASAAPGERTSIAAPVAPAAAPAAPGAATLVGRLVDEAGQPVAGAEVRARQGEFDFPELDSTRARNAGRLKTESDALGRFEIAGVKPGSARLTVRLAGYVPLNKGGIGIPAAPRHDLGDIALEQSVVLEGRVVDSRGVGVGGAQLHRATTDGFMTFEFSGDLAQGPPPLAVCAADGSFRIDQLASGPWRLRIASDAHPDKLEHGATQRPGELVAGLSIALEDGFEISGRVSGVPPDSVADVTVVAGPPAGQGEFVFAGLEESGLGENRRRAKLAADGGFTIQGLRAGSYQLQARVKSGPDVFWPRSASERVEAKSGDRGVVIAWQPASVLVFQVVDARTQEPIEKLEVSATTRGGMGFLEPGLPKDESYAQGRVRVDELRPRDANDRATLDVSATGYKSLHLEDISLTRGLETDLGVLQLERTAMVAVRVVDATTRGGLAKAKVTLTLAADGGVFGGGMVRARRAVVMDGGDSGDIHVGFGDSSTAVTDEDGWARLNSTPGSRGKLSVKLDGYAPFEGEEFELPSDSDLEQTIALDKGGAVEITLLSAEGAPVSGARIEHRPPSAGNDPMAEISGALGRGRGAATDAQGKVTYANLAPGLHKFRPARGGGPEAGGGMVFAFAGGGDAGPAWGEVEIVQGATASLELREPVRALVKGRVRESGSALAGATLSLKKRGGESRFEGMDDLPFGGGGPRTKTDGEGRYRFEKVDAGSYDLVVRHATRAMPARYPVEVDEDGLEFDVELQVTVLEGRVHDGEGKPVAGARVWAEKKRGGDGEVREFASISLIAGGDEGGGMVYDSGAGLDASRAKTDADGRYSLRGVESDVELEVRVEAKDCEPAKSDPVQVALGQTRAGVDVEVSPAGQIKAKLAAAGRPAGPCLVRAEYLDELAEGETVPPKIEFAQGGSATLKGLRPGRWRVYAEAIGGIPGGNPDSASGEAREVLVVARETAQVELPAP